MRKSKAIGFLLISFGILAVIAAGVLPVSPATQRLGPFRVDIRGDNCGPAGYVLLVVALGMAMFAGGDDPHGSRVLLGPPKVSRREARRSRGNRRYMPG